MNIFFCELNPELAAEALPDKLVVKMATEYVQILSSAIRLNGYEGDDIMKISYPKHPSVLSVVKNRKLATWLAECTLRLFEIQSIAKSRVPDFYQAFPKLYRCLDLLDLIPDDKYLTDLTTACNLFNDSRGIQHPVQVYRKFMVNDKVSFASWGKYGNKKPDWWSLDLFDYQIAWSLQQERNKNLKKPMSKDRFKLKCQEVFQCLEN